MNPSEPVQKLLLYNWVRFDHPWGWGGGVTIYCKNLVEAFLQYAPDTEIYFLSSGTVYEADQTETFCRKSQAVFGERVHLYEIVNSPVPADQSFILSNPAAAVKNEKLKSVFADFMREHGSFDAVHFHNLEGLSTDALELKKEFPDTQFVFSIHNYNTICLTGMYYMRGKHCICSPDHTEADCFDCARRGSKSDPAGAIFRRALVGGHFGKNCRKNQWLAETELDCFMMSADKEHINAYTRAAVENLNTYCDNILAVSERVYEIAVKNGFDKKKLRVMYIGTKIAARQGRPLQHDKAVSDRLKIVFLGNDIHNEEKGYPFLLRALGQLPPEYASEIDLFFTVRQHKSGYIKKCLKNFHSVTVKRGYTHDDFDVIFHDADLSIVPVLWEDNLPQIAIESAACGVPVLSSSAGGAKELCDDERFVFECGNEQSLIDRIKAIADEPAILEDYRKKLVRLETLESHIHKLAEIYHIKLTDTEPAFVPSQRVRKRGMIYRKLQRLRYCLKKGTVIVFEKLGAYRG